LSWIYPALTKKQELSHLGDQMLFDHMLTVIVFPAILDCK
jgi:hypothetical protein